VSAVPEKFAGFSSILQVAPVQVAPVASGSAQSLQNLELQQTAHHVSGGEIFCFENNQTLLENIIPYVRPVSYDMLLGSGVKIPL
jgi:hypothetical protein